MGGQSVKLDCAQGAARGGGLGRQVGGVFWIRSRICVLGGFCLRLRFVSHVTAAPPAAPY